MRQRLHVVFGKRARRRAHHRNLALAIAIFVQRLQQILILLSGKVVCARNARVPVLAMARSAQAELRGRRRRFGGSLRERERRGR